MRLLLDTNALLWWGKGSDELGPAARDAIDQASEVAASVVSLWEIAIKASIGRLRVDAEDFIAGVTTRSGLRLLSPTGSDCLRYLVLPLHHRDPFDRMLVAQALERDLALVTSDRALASYGVGIVRCG